jgi:hypothetical protein
MGAQPFAGKTNSEATEAVLAGKRLTKPDRCPNEVYELMLQCWQEKTKERPSMLEVYGKLKKLEGGDKTTTASMKEEVKPDEFYTLQDKENVLIYHKE